MIDRKSDEFCVYTASKFADGRGISILTKPDQAKNLAQFEAFTEPEILSSFGINELFDPPFEAVHIEGRGLGFVANRTIKRGEWLMTSTPVFMIVKGSMTELPQVEGLALQRLAIDSLPPNARDATYSLYGYKGQQAADKLEDIMDTNSFQISIDIELENEASSDHFEYKGLFPEIARFNHACRPTADYDFDTSRLSLQVTASRDILPGEELTITYIDPVQRHQARQEVLRKSWGFNCTCSACSASSKLVAASDTRIDTIIEIQEELADRTEMSQGSPKLAEKLISLLRTEQLWALVHDGYFGVAVEYNGIGDAVSAQRYALLALQTRSVCRPGGAIDDWDRDMFMLSTDPQTHPSWRFRESKSEV